MQTTSKLQEAEILLGQEQTVSHVRKSLGASELTYSRSRRECGGVRTAQTPGFKELIRETVRLKELVANPSPDTPIC